MILTPKNNTATACRKKLHTIYQALKEKCSTTEDRIICALLRVQMRYKKGRFLCLFFKFFVTW